MAEGKQQSSQKKQSSPQQQQQSPSQQEQSPEEQSAQQAAPLTGKVKWFNAVRGFGFITPDDGKPDLFVHQTSVHASGYRSLRDGEAVEFTIETGEDGRARACNVTGPNGEVVQGIPEDDYYAAAPSAGRGYSNGGGRGRGGAGSFSSGGRGRGGAGFAAGGGGGAAYGVCYSCSQPGHLARDCTKRGCYTCGEVGHFARDCTQSTQS